MGRPCFRVGGVQRLTRIDVVILGRNNLAVDLEDGDHVIAVGRAPP